MHNRYRVRIIRLAAVLTAAFLLLAGAGLVWGSRYISGQLLLANEYMAVDIAQLVKNNFRITDAEVAYMKGLTFNEMEVDPINARLMDVGNGVQLNTDVVNVYIVAPLAEDEIKYRVDAQYAEFFGYPEGTALDGIWLLNGGMDENGRFVPTEREDICRYTSLTDELRQGMAEQQPFGEFSRDAWGSFITGYTPIYTVEGSFVGLLGIDMDPDKYQESAKGMLLVLLASFTAILLVMVCSSFYFYIKYVRAREGQLYFDFYSRMSHDMRTPMNGILGMAALSRDETDVDTLHRNFAQVEDAGHYLLGLINDTLDVQKLDAGRLHLEPKVRSSHRLIENLLAMVRPDAEKKQIRLEFINKGPEAEGYLLIDELRTQQIFVNLVSNAIKFTPPGGRVTITAECLGAEGMVLHEKFTVTDTGIGMSREFINNHLFHPFEQEQNSVTTQYGGSGLGLSIVKKLVELMGGHIEVESTPGSGSTFVVYLDLKKVEDAAGARALAEPAAEGCPDDGVLAGKRVLLCEDHRLNAEIAARLLKKRGCEATTAENGKKGLETFAGAPAGTFDAILMDIRMPVMDGLEAARAIRALERPDAKTIPIIAMTANAYDEDREKSRAAGMDAHLAKPVDPEKLYATLAAQLKR